MSLDTRLRHAFTNLESRVTASIDTPNVPASAPQPPRRPGWALAIAAAAAVFVAIGVIAIVRSFSSEPDVAAPPTTIAPSESTATSGVVDSSPTTVAPDSGEGTPATTVPEAETSTTVTTTAPTTATTATSVPAAIEPGGFAVLAGETGLERHLGDENVIVPVTNTPALVGVQTAGGQLVYQETQDGPIMVLDLTVPDAQPSVFAAPPDGAGYRLLTVVTYPNPDEERIAFIQRQTLEDATASLILMNATDPSDIVQIDGVGGGETGVAGVSAADGMLLIERQGEGFIWYTARDTSLQEIAPPAGAPTEPCEATTQAGCLASMRLLPGGVIVAADLTGDLPAVVLLEGGVESRRYGLPDVTVRDIDVSGRLAIINTWVAAFAEPGEAYLVFTDGDSGADPVALSMIGYATLAR